jgi:TonB family protein
MNSQHTAPAAATAGGSSSATPGINRPPELRLLLAEQPRDFKTLFGGGVATYVVLVALLLLGVWLRPDRRIQAKLPDLLTADIVFLEVPGPGGGGGGGGNKSPEPPKTEKAPAVKPPEPEPPPVPTPKPPEPKPEPEPVPELAAITAVQTPAVLASAPSTAPTSLGTGSNNGAGTGTGGGIGPGRGNGVGDGVGGNTGGGYYQVGNGVLPPVALFVAKPLYTSEAMLRRIQGEAELDCVVLADGNVGKCDVAKSLDQNQFGLDNEALKAAKRFRFRPGTRQGEPVAVLVRIILEFNMR